MNGTALKQLQLKDYNNGSLLSFGLGPALPFFCFGLLSFLSQAGLPVMGSYSFQKVSLQSSQGSLHLSCPSPLVLIAWVASDCSYACDHLLASRPHGLHTNSNGLQPKTIASIEVAVMRRL